MTRPRRHRRLATVLLATATLGTVVVTPTSAAPAPAPVPTATVVSETWVDERTLDLRIESPALGGVEAPVRLLLPAGWEPDSGQSWPTLWLLHGCCEVADYESWTRFTDVEEFTADKPAIIVMPTGGKISMYSKWWNYGLSDVPDWPTFHLTELRQILERDYGAGTERSVAGLSMGGYGAMEYASRFPGMFGAAASYSAALDVLSPGIPEITQMNMLAQGFLVWGVLWGDPWSQRARWSDHNPFDKVDKLRGTELFVSCGSGGEGPLDIGDVPIVGGMLETAALPTSVSFVAKLRANGIPVTADFYGPGTHSWPYWERALKRSWPMLASGMGIPA